MLTEMFDDYWEGKPYLDEVKYVLIRDSVTAQLAFEDGEAESVSLVGKSYLLLRNLLPKGFVADTYRDLKSHMVPSAGDPNQVGVANSGPLGNAMSERHSNTPSINRPSAIPYSLVTISPSIPSQLRPTVTSKI
jgi:ABC-type transport system substrate-binding protein